MTRPLTDRRPRGESLESRRRYERWVARRAFEDAREALYEAATSWDVDVLSSALARYQSARRRCVEAK